MSADTTVAPRNTIPPESRILLGEDDAARMLSMSKPTLRKYVRDGLIARVESPLDTRRNWYAVAELLAFADRLGRTTEVRQEKSAAR